MRIPAIAEIGTQTASLTRDGIMINCYPEKREGEYEAAKRTGTSNASVVSPALAGYGFYYWPADGKFWSAVGTKIYRDGTDKSVTSDGVRHGFCECGTVSKRLFIEGGTKAWYGKTDGTITALADADYTGTIAASPGTVGTPVELDGYVFVARADGRIFHSDNVDTDVANIDVWDPLNYIAVTESDTLHALFRHNAFIGALGDKAVEFFYDAGNADGSVLAPVQASVIRMGASSKSTLATIGDMAFYVASLPNGGYHVVMIEGMKPAIITDTQVARVLGTGTGHQTMTGVCASVNGHQMYILTVGSNTLAFDIATKMWVQFTPWPWVASTMKAGDTYYQHDTLGDIVMASEAYQDYNPVTSTSANIESKIRSPSMQFAKPNAKIMARLGLECSKFTTAPTLRYSDDENSTYSTARTFPVVNPILHALGRFFRRSVEVSHSANEDFRLRAIHVDV